MRATRATRLQLGAQRAAQAERVLSLRIDARIKCRLRCRVAVVLRRPKHVHARLTFLQRLGNAALVVHGSR